MALVQSSPPPTAWPLPSAVECLSLFTTSLNSSQLVFGFHIRCVFVSRPSHIANMGSAMSTKSRDSPSLAVGSTGDSTTQISQDDSVAQIPTKIAAQLYSSSTPIQPSLSSNTAQFRARPSTMKPSRYRAWEVNRASAAHRALSNVNEASLDDHYPSYSDRDHFKVHRSAMKVAHEDDFLLRAKRTPSPSSPEWGPLSPQSSQHAHRDISRTHRSNISASQEFENKVARLVTSARSPSRSSNHSSAHSSAHSLAHSSVHSAAHSSSSGEEVDKSIIQSFSNLLKKHQRSTTKVLKMSLNPRVLMRDRSGMGLKMQAYRSALVTLRNTVNGLDPRRTMLMGRRNPVVVWHNAEIYGAD